MSLSKNQILIVGQNSFLGQSFINSLRLKKLDKNILAVSHKSVHSVKLEKFSTIINFAMHPLYVKCQYRESNDFDLYLAKRIYKQSTNYIFLSSRLVYCPSHWWMSQEESPLRGINNYAQNKINTEKKLMEILDKKVTILRLSNVFGYEYLADRKTFFGIALKTLKNENKILLDISPETRKDFLPDYVFNDILYKIIETGYQGILNIGSGYSLPISKIANWLIKGYGSGSVEVAINRSEPNFLLNINKFKDIYFNPCAIVDIKRYCLNIGKRLSLE